MKSIILKSFQIISIVLVFSFLLSCTKDEETEQASPDYKSIEYVQVNGGSFLMGSDDGNANEQPVHQVSLNGFQISKHEITNYQFCDFLNAIECPESGSFNGVRYIDPQSSFSEIQFINGQFSPIDDKYNHPVVVVSWYGATAFCAWKDGRLPTEAEWEYAARGGSNSMNYTYSGSNNPDEVAWYFVDFGNGSQVVGAKRANELGIYDMSGNILEWCSDWYDYNYYSVSPEDNPIGPSTGTGKVTRGGSWYHSADNVKVYTRFTNADPNTTNSYTGFRLVK